LGGTGLTKPIELLSNPLFVADLKSRMVGSEIAAKWDVSKTTANKWKARLAEADGLPAEIKLSALKGDYTENWSGKDGTLSVVVHEDLTPEQILIKFGWNPEERRIVGDAIEERHWTSAGEYQHYYKFKTERGAQSEDLTVKDLPLLYSQIADREIKPAVIGDEGRSLVVIWADIQVGKTGSRGGTPELIDRVAEKRRALALYAAEANARDAYFLSVGDEVESFENTPQQAFTNDLSFPDQLDLELTFELDMLTTLASLHDSVTVAGCSSNHCRWRAGKNALGKPADDYGLYIKRQLEKALRLNSSYDHIGFVYPEEWDETVAVDVQGTKIGLAHGHQVNNPNGIEAWWTKQAFGAQATAEADILCTGHFHTFRAQPMGRSLKSGKNRWWLQAPTLDNGSDWFRNIAGSDSDAGMLVFCVDENGLDLQSLTIL
jgi:hypothetical protein